MVIWFPHLVTDRLLRKQPELKELPFVLVTTERGRRIVKAVNVLAKEKGIHENMVLADCKALVPELTVLDYDEAVQLAKQQNKPLLIDFTGWACVNCRRMEENIWPDKIVDSLMRNEFIVVSLYVDEKNNLPINEQTVEILSNKEEIEVSCCCKVLTCLAMV